MKRFCRTLMYCGILGSVILYGGCCKLPLINCGPEISSIKVNPTKINITENNQLMFQAWEYIPRNSDNKLIRIECNYQYILSTGGEYKFDQTHNIFCNDNNVNLQSEFSLYDIEFSDSLVQKTYSLEISDFYWKFPTKVIMDSIPIVSNVDTSFMRLTLKLEN